MATVTKRRRRSSDEQREIEQEALGRAAGGVSMANYLPIIAEFAARGIPESEIIPRENVFTFHAWRALGRTVRKGEKGVAVITWVPFAGRERDKATGEEKTVERSRPRTAYVFHVSQTEALPTKGA